MPAALAQPDAEVTVIDNASSDATGELARRHGARHLRLAERASWAAANNAGIDATRGPAVLLLNADCFLQPDFLAAACPRLEEDRAGSVTPKLLRTLGPLPEQRLEEIDCVGMSLDRRRKNGLAGHGAPAGAYDVPGEVIGPDGAAALYRRETLDDCRLGGAVLDEAFEKWASDVDLAWRAWTLGWRSVYEPRAVGYHVRSYSPSTRANVPERDRRVQFRNRYLMMAKNDTAALARDLHRVAFYELQALGFALLRERFLLGGYADVLRLAPRARRMRRELR
ncbi:MAG: glycosyltransferase, partial [Actinomycetota bacterium]|nr:glycosyltransferase [Actinomycetota bacterium]